MSDELVLTSFARQVAGLLHGVSRLDHHLLLGAVRRSSARHSRLVARRPVRQLLAAGACDVTGQLPAAGAPSSDGSVHFVQIRI